MVRYAMTLAAVLLVGTLAACSDDDPVAVVVEEEPFDSIGTDCVPVDTIPGAHIPVICT